MCMQQNNNKLTDCSTDEIICIRMYHITEICQSFAAFCLVFAHFCHECVLGFAGNFRIELVGWIHTGLLYIANRFAVHEFLAIHSLPIRGYQRRFGKQAISECIDTFNGYTIYYHVFWLFIFSSICARMPKAI